MTKRLRWTLLLVLALVCAAIFIVPGLREAVLDLLSSVRRGDGPEVRDAIRDYGLLAPIVSVGLALLHIVFPFPAEVLALANGLAFGFWGGLVTTWSGFMLSALVMYAAGNALGRPLLRRFVREKYRNGLEDWLAREGSYPLLVARLIPLVPFNALCLAAGALEVRFRTYVWTTAVGILPLDIALSYVGSRLGADAELGAWFWTVLILLLIFALVAWRLSKRIDLASAEGDRDVRTTRR